MAAPLDDCNIYEQRAVVPFLWAEGIKSAEIHCRMLAQYGARTMHQRKIYEWLEPFKVGRTSVTDESRPGRPSTSRTDQHIQRVDALDQRRPTTHVSTCSTGSARMVTSSKRCGRGFVSNWKFLFWRDKEARWMIPEVHHCAGRLCRNVACSFVLHLRN
jgi:hypothetical protein